MHDSMTAKDLIDCLVQFPPDTPIIIRGYEEGYNDILHIIPRMIIPHPEQKTDYYGEYIEARTENEKNAAINAIELYSENKKAEK